jgi:cytoplasmic iron level regulating protein YaaA (DUF328/UPF0246 family)
VLILLPPSEAKTAPRRGAPLDLDRLGSPALTDARAVLVAALVELCAGPDADRAATVLGLGPSQHDLVRRNAELHRAPAARADRVYTGVLYDALGFDGLSPAARRRAATRVAVTSSLFGLLAPGDRVPAYRLSGDVTLPGIGAVAGFWRRHLDPVIRDRVGSGLLVDLRSGTYAGFWRPAPELAKRVASVRVLHEHQGARKVVSHFNKATKGRIVRAVLEDGRNPRTPAAFADLLRDLGWKVEEGSPVGPTRSAEGTRLDVVVDEV